MPSSPVSCSFGGKDYRVDDVNHPVGSENVSLDDLGSMTQVTQKEGSLFDSEGWAPNTYPGGKGDTGPVPVSD